VGRKRGCCEKARRWKRGVPESVENVAPNPTLALTGMNIANDWVHTFPRGRVRYKIQLWERRRCLPVQEHGGDGEIQGNPWHLPRSFRVSIESRLLQAPTLGPSVQTMFVLLSRKAVPRIDALIRVYFYTGIAFGLGRRAIVGENLWVRFLRSPTTSGV
jgi:hypothetical protein